MDIKFPYVLPNSDWKSSYKTLKPIVSFGNSPTISYNPFYDYLDFSFLIMPCHSTPINKEIKTIGGYFQFYPQFYKDKFRKIIANELNKDILRKKDFDIFGHRLYAFVVNNRDIDLNFDQMKKMQVSYLLSDKKLFNENLHIVCESCNKNPEMNLYSLK